ncbi:MAG: acyltransferase 3 [Pedosphaera sp.]|nr:acyltransferase 3 [Pedosphaera sp.]
MRMENRLQPPETVATKEAAGKPSRPHLGHLRPLDGLRGVSILLVILTHLEVLQNNFGFVGVDVFFVLSGFLITCLLLQEWDETGGISLRAFYARRALRLFPALVVMLAAFMVYSTFRHTRELRLLEAKEALATLAYSTNWVVALEIFPTNFLAHTWSLSIEEQFYLLWPALLLWLVRRSSRSSLFCFVALGIALSWLVRFLLFLGTAASSVRLSRGLDTRADALLMGCAIGVLFFELPRPGWLRQVLNYCSAASLAGLLLMAQVFNTNAPGMLLAGWFFISLLAGIIVLALAFESGGVLQWVLNNSVLVYLGKISYGLYLWHYPIFLACGESDVIWARSWIVKISAALLATLASYYLLELPFLRLKQRFRRTK